MQPNSKPYVGSKPSKINMNFYCDVCKYTTNRKYNIAKHFQSAKHIKMSKQHNTSEDYCTVLSHPNIPNEGIIDPVHGLSLGETLPFVCEVCGSHFDNRMTKYRHTKNVQKLRYNIIQQAI
jgi:ribosomal protein L44E